MSRRRTGKTASTEAPHRAAGGKPASPPAAAPSPKALAKEALAKRLRPKSLRPRVRRAQARREGDRCEGDSPPPPRHGRFRGAHRLSLQGCRAARAGAHAHFRAHRCAQPRRLLSAARVSRRSRARPRRLRHAVSRLRQGRRRGNVAPPRRPRAQGGLRGRGAGDRSRGKPSGSARPRANAGGRGRTAILADVCEALIGAVFIDGGYPAASALIERLWSERMRTPARPLRDSKTVLQEWAQARGLPTPAYREVERKGPDHDPEFRVTVELPTHRAGRGARPFEARRRAGRRRRHADACRRQGGPPRWLRPTRAAASSR